MQLKLEVKLEVWGDDSAANDNIAGMEGSVQPADEVVANDENDEYNQQRHYVRDFFLLCSLIKT